MGIEEFVTQLEVAVTKSDVEQIRRLSAQFQQAQIRCAGVLQKTGPAIILFHPATGTIVDANALALSWLGCEKETLQQQSIQALHPCDARDALWETYSTLGLSESTALSQVPFLIHDGQTATVDGSASCCVHDGHQLIQLTLDVLPAETTGPRAPQAPYRYLTAVTQELLKPMQAILGYNSLLAEEVYGSLTPNQKKAVDLIDANASSGIEIIHQMIHLSRLSTGSVLIVPEPIDLIQTVRETLLEYKKTAETKGLALELNHPPDHIVCTTDRSRFMEILRHLFSYVIQFTEKGLVSVRMDLIQKQALLTVTDTSMGLSQETYNKINYCLKQGDLPAHQTSQGGLGLAIAKQLADLLGMQISLAGPSPEGTCFKLRIPHGIQADTLPLTKEKLLEPLEKERAHPTSKWAKTVVIADTDPAMTEILSEFIESRVGYKVLKAYGSLHAMLILAQMQPDVLLLHLPEGSDHQKRIIQYCQELWGNKPTIAVIHDQSVDPEPGEAEKNLLHLDYSTMSFAALLKQLESLFPEPVHPRLKQAFS
ncbi:MAG: ATP-binding protein [bacterium]|jgi:signal transduction histidine kinase|nr:ATP-binding protein [bacterium]